MPTRRELATDLARYLEEQSSKNPLAKIMTTGRVIAVGDPYEELNVTKGEQQTISTVVPEMSVLGKTISSLFFPALKESREGMAAMTYGDMTKKFLEVNKRKFKKREDVTIFDKNGPVKK